MPSGSNAVEFFFILAGFTLAMSARRRTAKLGAPPAPGEARRLAIDFVKKKLLAIYPALVITLLLGIVLYPALGIDLRAGSGFYGPAPGLLRRLMDTEWELLMLVGTPFGVNNFFAPIIPLWFLTALLLVGYIYTYAINRHYELTVFLAPALGVLLYILFTLNSSMLIDHSVKMGAFNAATVHAAAEMSLGIAAATLCNHLSKKKFGAIAKAALSLLELYAIFRFLALTFYQPVSLDNFRRIPYLMLIIMFSFLNQTWFSRFMNKAVWRGPGRISLAMYLAHMQLIQVYIQGLDYVKVWLMKAGSARAESWLLFLRSAGNTRAAAMSWKDAVLFTLFTAAAALVIIGLGAAARRGFSAARERLERRAQQGD
jgi:peptidoglycan/LPS O-acetylase OafA/YrhL